MEKCLTKIAEESNFNYSVPTSVLTTTNLDLAKSLSLFLLKFVSTKKQKHENHSNRFVRTYQQAAN
jgi:hypothetical protein